MKALQTVSWSRVPRGVSWVLATIVATLATPAAFGQGAVPAGDELVINTYTSSSQLQPRISRLDDGFVAVWRSDGSSGSDDDDSSIQGRRYGAGGAALGPQFQVNTFTPRFQFEPAVATLPGGDFVVVWRGNESSGSDTSHGSVNGRLYDAGGGPSGPEFQVNSYTTGTQGSPAVAGLAGGDFVVTWKSLRSSAPNPFAVSVQAQRFAADGVPLGEQFKVNTHDNGNSDGAVAGLADGSFVVVWESSDAGGSDTSREAISAQRYAADGTPLGPEHQVNSYTSSHQWQPQVAALAGGGYVVVWESWGSFGSDTRELSVQGQRFTAHGFATGPQFQVNSVTLFSQEDPAVAALDGGGWIVTWTTQTYESGVSIRGQRYAADGAMLEGEFQVSTLAEDSRGEPSVAAQPDGGFVVAWKDRSDLSTEDIHGRRFTPPRYFLTGLGGKCLDVENGDPASGTPVNLYRCTGGENQRWRLDLTAVPQKIAGLGGKCLLPGPQDDSGGPRAVIGDCGTIDADWQVITGGTASPSALIHVETGLCLDVEGAVAGDGTPTQLFECHGGANQVWRPAAETCTPDSLGLCLNRERFQIDVDWRSFDGTTGSGRVAPADDISLAPLRGDADSGLLWFFESTNWEMLIKVLDGCAINDRLWVFAAATTTVEYTLRVTDTETGIIREYFNPLGSAAAAITDTGAFATCSASGAKSARTDSGNGGIRPRSRGAQQHPAGEPKWDETCEPTPTRKCLRGRFAIEVDWRDYAGITGAGRAVADTPTPDSGLFWFFNADNWEMLVKVLDACDVNGRFWMLAAATTDVEYTLRVTDTETGAFREYSNPLGTAAPALVDTFETCP